MKKLFVSLLIGFLAIACKPEYPISQTTEGENLKSVKVMQPKVLEKPIPVRGSGKISAQKEMVLSFKIGGIVNQMYAEEGQRVTKGQVLAVLNRTEINAQVEKARQSVKKLERDLQRIENLFADTVATLEQVQDLRTALDVAKSDLEIAQFNQQYSQIKSPATGKILRKMAETSELVQGGTPIFILAANEGKGSYKLQIGISDREIIQLNMSDSANIRFDAYPNEVFKAHVTEIGEAANPMTGTYEIELTLSDPQKELKNGFIGKAEIFPSGQEKLMKIPMLALVAGEGKQVKLKVLERGKSEVKQVDFQVKSFGEDYFTIAEKDWQGNMQLITEGAAYVQPGERVKVNSELAKGN